MASQWTLQGRPEYKRSSLSKEEESSASDYRHYPRKRPRTRSPNSVSPKISTRISKLSSCRSVTEYERLNLIDEGTYGRVYRARDIHSGKIYALKQIKNNQEREGFPITSLREISILLELKHKNVINVREVVVGKTLDKIYMVMEYVENDLKDILEKMTQPYTISEIKSILLQLLNGIEYLHDNWILHRDLKTSNILLTSQGVVKICDFGLARFYGHPLKSYTPGVVTLWYRAPELLLGVKKYSTAIDIWSVGCIFAELILLDSLFTGKGELHLLNQMTDLLGTPREQIWNGYNQLENAKRITFKKQYENRLPQRLLYGGYFTDEQQRRRPHLSAAGLDLIQRMLCYDPEKRISASEALKHAYFDELPHAKDAELIQTFPEDYERYKRMRRR